MRNDDLRRRRVALGLNAVQLAERLHVPLDAVPEWESGARRIPGWLDVALRGVEASAAPVDVAAEAARISAALPFEIQRPAAWPAVLAWPPPAAGPNREVLARGLAAWFAGRGPERAALRDAFAGRRANWRQLIEFAVGQSAARDWLLERLRHNNRTD